MDTRKATQVPVLSLKNAETLLLSNLHHLALFLLIKIGHVFQGQNVSPKLVMLCLLVHPRNKITIDCFTCLRQGLLTQKNDRINQN